MSVACPMVLHIEDFYSVACEPHPLFPWGEEWCIENEKYLQGSREGKVKDEILCCIPEITCLTSIVHWSSSLTFESK